jgi:hypothetical protein
MSLIETSSLSGLEAMAIDYGLDGFHEYANKFSFFMRLEEVDYDKFITEELVMEVDGYSFRFKTNPEETDAEMAYGWLKCIYTDTFEVSIVGDVEQNESKQLVTSNSLSQDELEDIVFRLALLTSDYGMVD